MAGDDRVGLTGRWQRGRSSRTGADGAWTRGAGTDSTAYGLREKGIILVFENPPDICTERGQPFKTLIVKDNFVDIQSKTKQ